MIFLFFLFLLFVWLVTRVKTSNLMLKESGDRKHCALFPTVGSKGSVLTVKQGVCCGAFVASLRQGEKPLLPPV